MEETVRGVAKEEAQVESGLTSEVWSIMANTTNTSNLLYKDTLCKQAHLGAVQGRSGGAGSKASGEEDRGTGDGLSREVFDMTILTQSAPRSCWLLVYRSMY